jgi:hypothetical protein
VAEIVYIEGRGTPSAVFHAVGQVPYGDPRVTRCGMPVSPAMPEAQRTLAAKAAVPCPRCYAATPPT